MGLHEALKKLKLKSAEEAPKTEKEPEVLGKLKKIAEGTGVNPPPPVETATKDEQCPQCGKAFKHLSRHKCTESLKTEAASVAEPAPQVKEESKNRFAVLVDCLYEKNALKNTRVVLLSEFVSALTEDVAKENKVTHWSCVEFAQGGPQLAAKLKQRLADEPFEGVILVDSSSKEAQATLEVLKQNADVVVRGIR